MLYRIFKLIPLFILASCAGHTAKTPYDFSGFDNNRLCRSAKWVYATQNHEGVINPYLTENKIRNLLTEAEFNEVFKRQATSKDSACFIVATGGDASLIESKQKQDEPNKYNYNLGLKDGCDSGNLAGGSVTGRQAKNVELYVNNVYYKNGYDDAYSKCKNESDQLNRAITESLNRGW
jgi:hypothetical protein